MRARPFDVVEGDAPVLARKDGVDHALVGQRLDIATPLQLGLDLVDRARDVDREHELQIDRSRGPRRQRSRQTGQGSHKSGSSLHVRLRKRWSENSTAAKKNAGGILRRSTSVLTKRLLIVVEAALARLVIALAPLRSGIAPPLRPGHLGSGAAGRIEAGSATRGATG